MMKKKIIPLISIILSILLMISCLSLSASASDVVATATHGGAATPTDLTGYTVTVPSGWSATSGYGIFDIDYSLPDSSDSREYDGIFYVGISLAYDEPRPESDVVFSYPTMISFTSSSEIKLSIGGGIDSTNSTLIQWFVDNNATFTLTNSDADFPVLPGSYTFTRSDLIASMSKYIGITGLLSHPAITNMDNSVGVLGINIAAGDPGVITLNGIGENYITSDNIGVWHNTESYLALCPVLDSTLTIYETVYSQALLDFLTLNTDYEEVNTPDDPVEYITLPSGVYIFDSLLQVPSNVGIYPIEFRSDQAAFYGISLDSVLSYGNSSLDAFAPVYSYSDNTWVKKEYRIIMLEEEQRVDKRLGDYFLTETEYLTLDDYFYLYRGAYDSGYEQGYLKGKNLSDSDSFINGFFGDFFGGVREALDSLVLYESTNTVIPIVVSVWDVISTLVMLFVVLFVLKLVAGG